MKVYFFVLILAAASLARADEIAVHQASLGRWHYLHRLDEQVYAITQTDPMTIVFGSGADRVALLMPGSNLVAEFKDGHFFDLRLPAAFTPCSLGADRQGKLWCLAQKLVTSGYGDPERWVFALKGTKWSAPRQVPFNICDRLEFDAQNRLWALGPARTVSVLGKGGDWDTFTYSDDAKLGFTRIRLANDAGGDPVLFAYQMPWSESHLIGTLTYRAGRFVHDPNADTKSLIEAQSAKEPENAHYPNDPPAGQVMPEFAGLRERTVLAWNGWTFVSLGTEGFAWTGPGDAATPLLSTEKEWDEIPHINIEPAIDLRGDLWMVREGRTLTEVTAQGRTDFAIDPAVKELGTSLDFDAKGRPWITKGLSGRDSVLIFADGHFISYANISAALRAEAPNFAPGRVLPFAIKAPSSLLVYGGPHSDYESVSVIDGAREARYLPADIDPAEPSAPRPGHGYDLFRGSELWLDKSGAVHVWVLNQDFVYTGGKWAASGLKDEKESVVAQLPAEDTNVVPADFGPHPGGAALFYDGFHFFWRNQGVVTQLDFGLNSTAQYPFESRVVKAFLDPAGHIWTQAGDQGYSSDQTWYVSRAALPSVR